MREEIVYIDQFSIIENILTQTLSTVLYNIVFEDLR